MIESVGEIADLERVASGSRLRIRTALAGHVCPGESLAVNGVCLTVTLAQGDVVAADIGAETARVTTLGAVPRGRRVNLERSMRADARFGGHVVQGHVDGTGTLEEVRGEGDAHWLRVAYPPALAPFFIHRGAVAVDGVSLTIARLENAWFEVMIIPFTWTHTALSALAPRERVNLECDVIGKYVARSLELAGAMARARIEAR